MKDSINRSGIHRQRVSAAWQRPVAAGLPSLTAGLQHRLANSFRSAAPDCNRCIYRCFRALRGQWQAMAIMFPRRLASTSVAVLLLVSGAASQAADDSPLPSPSDQVLLSISGNISKTNQGSEAHFDIAMLESLPQTQFVTSTPWSEGPVKFEGVRLNDLLAYTGAGSQRFLATALDDYEVEFSGIDLDHYPVLLAFRENDRYLSVRTLGPLRIIFPFDEYPELLNQSNMTISVWQLTELHVH